jgi:hypothetical protein
MKALLMRTTRTLRRSKRSLAMCQLFPYKNLKVKKNKTKSKKKRRRRTFTFLKLSIRQSAMLILHRSFAMTLSRNLWTKSTVRARWSALI